MDKRARRDETESCDHHLFDTSPVERVEFAIGTYLQSRYPVLQLYVLVLPKHWRVVISLQGALHPRQSLSVSPVPEHTPPEASVKQQDREYREEEEEEEEEEERTGQRERRWTYPSVDIRRLVPIFQSHADRLPRNISRRVYRQSTPHRQ